MFTLKLYDRLGKELKEGDIVRISDGKVFNFYAEVKYLEAEKVITPFHTFSFHSFEKVDCVPEGATKSTEERYGIWWVGSSDPENDNNAKDHEKYLMDWRVCESLINKRNWRIEKAVIDTKEIRQQVNELVFEN